MTTARMAPVLAILLVAVGCGGDGTPPAAPEEAAPQPPGMATRESSIPADAVKITPATDVYPPQLHSDAWETPVPLPAAINTAGAEDSPFVTPDGSTFYFFFTPDPNVPPQKQLLDGVTGVWVSHQKDGAWQPAVQVVLQDPGKLALDGAPCIQGDTMWFCSAREGFTGVNLFTARWKDGRWQNWQYVGDRLMQDFQMGEMHVTADGAAIYFHSPRPGGKGQYDIWVTRKVGGEWQEPENVAAVNSEETDGWPFVSQDGRELWFTRTYKGSPAIFRSKSVDGRRWQAPAMILSQFAAEPSLDAKGNLYFAHHYFKDGRMLEADLYVARKK